LEDRRWKKESRLWGKCGGKKGEIRGQNDE